jgi:hypothetical protein
MAAITDMFSRYPETMTCLGRDDHGIFVLWGIIHRAQDNQMLPFLLDSARDHRVSPLLPYSPQAGEPDATHCTHKHTFQKKNSRTSITYALN